MSITPVKLDNQKILVTGPSSQVALPLVKALVEQGNEVHGLARFTREKDKKKIEDLGAKIIKKDLAIDSLDDLPDDFNYVLNFAVVKSGDFEYDLNANAEGAGRLIAQCRQAKAFLHISSGGVYEYAGHELLTEDSPLGDNHRAMFPTYSICKIAAETVVRFAGKQFGVPTVIARLSMPYGDNGGWPFWHLMMMKNKVPIDIHPEQPNTYNPIHHDDYIEQLPYVLAAAKPESYTLNWGGSQQVSIEEWCAYLTELTGLEASFNLTPTAFGSLTLDTSRIEEIYGKSKVDWKDGVLRLVQNLAPDLLLKTG
jgi:nucleoside-diphosphate-sugar epimerase